MSKFKYICTFLLFAILSSCKDEIEFSDTIEQKLPPITSDGNGTFGCLVNGKLWLPKEYKDYARCNYYPWVDSKDLFGTLSIVSYCNKFEGGKTAAITIQLRKRVFGIGKHLVYRDNVNNDIVKFRNDITYFEGNGIDTSNFIIISRLDSIERIVSGTFQFNLLNLNNNLDTQKFTEGRFDLKF